MNPRMRSMVGWACASVLFLSTPSRAAGGPVGLTPGEPTGHVRVAGPANCNCTGGDAKLTVCHVSKVDVRSGGATMSVSTGQSESSCGSKTVPDGQCIYYQYNFSCEKTWIFVDCWFVGTGLKQRDATERDC